MEKILEGFKVACLFVAISYFLPNEYEGAARLLMQYGAALTGYFGCLIYLKKQKQEWNSKEILGGIFISVVALWVLVIIKVLIKIINAGFHP